MLRQLSIQNYALIDQLDVVWPEGFSVITGETGSGKSILMGALGLILGKRADTSVLRNDQKKCVAEASFTLSKSEFQDFFTEHDLDYEEQTTIRREINKSGKSRAFINDTPVTLTQLKQLTSRLVDIHSQHETLHLKDNQFQRALLDDFAGLRGAVKKYSQTFGDLKKAEMRVASLKESIRKEQQMRDFREFQLREISEANLAADEQSGLEEELSMLNSAEEIKAALVHSTETLQYQETNVLGMLGFCMQQLQPIKDKSSALEELYKRLKSAAIELKDVAREMEGASEDLEHNPERAALVQERIDLIYQLQQKHGVDSIEGLLNLAEELDSQLVGFTDLEDELAASEQLAAELQESAKKQAGEISAKRQKSAQKLEKVLNEVLHQLEMKSAMVKVVISPLEELNESGADKVAFLLKANKGHDFMPIESVASGGELSRVMLAVKSVSSESGNLPTLILDEIETGVSGKVANAMASLLEEMGNRRQLICITHLPQIAARGEAHFRVSKTEKDQFTSTEMERLTDEGRLHEIAGMLSGYDTTDAAIENARALMHLN